MASPSASTSVATLAVGGACLTLAAATLLAAASGQGAIKRPALEGPAAGEPITSSELLLVVDAAAGRARAVLLPALAAVGVRCINGEPWLAPLYLKPPATGSSASQAAFAAELLASHRVEVLGVILVEQGLDALSAREQLAIF